MRLATAAWIPREDRFTANVSSFFTYLLPDHVTRDGVDAPPTTHVAVVGGASTPSRDHVVTQ